MRTGIPKLNRKELGSYHARLPPLGEQRKIAAILGAVDEAIARTQAVIEQVQVVKKGLMQDLLTRGLPGRHTRFKQTEIGQIPESWSAVRLGDVLDGIDAGWSPKCANHPAGNGEWGVLKVSSVSSGIYKPEENKMLPDDLIPKPELEVRPGDVIIARASGVLDLVGVCSFVYKTRPRLMLSDKTLRVRPNRTLLDSFYLALTLQSPVVRSLVLEKATGSHMRNISQKAIGSVTVALPSLDEQVKVSSGIMAMDARIDNDTRSVESLTELKSALMSVLLTGEVRVTPDEESAS